MVCIPSGRMILILNFLALLVPKEIEDAQPDSSRSMGNLGSHIRAPFGPAEAIKLIYAA